MYGNKVFVGLDLGKTRDPSAIAVVEREEPRLAWMPSMPRRMEVRYLQRIPLGTPYTRVVERVGQVVRHPRLYGRCRLVVDATGVGAPVVDLLKAARLECPPTAVTIISGDRAHKLRRELACAQERLADEFAGDAGDGRADDSAGVDGSGSAGAGVERSGGAAPARGCSAHGSGWRRGT